MSETRKLATVLFADIAGYTALMQKNEQQALQFLTSFKEVLELQTQHHNGQIVQFFGDGCLLSFESSTQAVECAVALQDSFIDSHMPVRIGMHLGETVFKNDNAFGDGVNIASRIESLGIPGSILLSKSIRDQVRNKTEFQLVSLGHFAFKNVDEPMEVFAISNEGLVVPKSGEISGKGRPTKSRVSAISIIGMIAGVLLLALVVQFVYSNWSARGTEAAVKTDRSQTERIAVVPFENLTTDPTLDNFGKIAANFINLALMNIENAEVVSPATVETNLSSIGILPGDPSNRTSFSELTGAHLVIAGNYFMDEERLTLALQVQNAQTGKLQFVLPHLSREKQDKESIISEAKEKMMGYWAAKDMVESKRIRLPDLEAYSLFLNRSEIEFGPDQLERILSLDSNFYLARIEWLNHARWLFHHSKPNHFRFLDRHMADLTHYERTLYAFVKNLYQGNSLTTFKKVNELRKRFPRDFGLNHDAAGIAYDELNNPLLSLQIYNELPLESVELPLIPGGHPRLRNEIVCRSIQAGNKAQNKEHLTNLVDKIQWTDSRKFVPSLYAIMTQDEELYLEILEDDLAAASTPGDKFARLVPRFEWDYRSTFSTPEMNRYLIEASMSCLKDHPKGDIQREIISQVMLVIEGSPVSLDFRWRDVADPNGPWAPYQRYLYWTALGKIQGGDMEIVHQIIQELESLVTDNLTLAASYAAFPFYHIGCIYAKMGDPENAMKYLRKAKEMGLYAAHYQFNYDKHLESLTNQPDFREIVAPIWPEQQH